MHYQRYVHKECILRVCTNFFGVQNYKHRTASERHWLINQSGYEPQKLAGDTPYWFDWSQAAIVFILLFARYYYLHFSEEKFGTGGRLFNLDAPGWRKFGNSGEKFWNLFFSLVCYCDYKNYIIKKYKLAI